MYVCICMYTSFLCIVPVLGTAACDGQSICGLHLVYVVIVIEIHIVSVQYYSNTLLSALFSAFPHCKSDSIRVRNCLPRRKLKTMVKLVRRMKQRRLMIVERSPLRRNPLNLLLQYVYLCAMSILYYSETWYIYPCGFREVCHSNPLLDIQVYIPQ